MVTLHQFGDREIEAVQLGDKVYKKESKNFKVIMEDFDAVVLDNPYEPHCSIGNGWLCNSANNYFQEIYIRNGDIVIFN